MEHSVHVKHSVDSLSDWVDRQMAYGRATLESGSGQRKR